MSINVINTKPELNIASIFSTYRYPFSALFLMQKGYFPVQTNDITLTSNPSSPLVALCRNFTINSGVTYSKPYICITATNSITINGDINVSSSGFLCRSFFLNKEKSLYIDTSIYNDIPAGGGFKFYNVKSSGFGGGNAGGDPLSDHVNPPFNYRVLYTNFYQETNDLKQTTQSVQKAGGFASGSGPNTGGIAVLCAPTIVINRNILAHGSDDMRYDNFAYGRGGGVIYIVGNTITIGNVSINAKGGNAITSSNYQAYGGGGGFIVIAGTQRITNNATINVNGGTASGGYQNLNGQNGSLIIQTFSFDFDYTGNF